ncbi:MAG: MBL fold metallo-hydrolase [Pelagibacteraceae bacterium]
MIKIQNTFLILIITLFIFMTKNVYSETKYHHMADGTFRNVEGSPTRSGKSKWSYWTFYQEKKKLKINIPKDHVINKTNVLNSLETNKDQDYFLWIGHATFLMKLGKHVIITDPIFSKNAGPLFLGSYRYVDPAIPLKKIPKTNLLLLTHSHYDHLDTRTLKRFPHKETKVITPLKLGKYFSSRKFKDVNELDWLQSKVIDQDLKITLIPAVHWSKRTPFDTNKALWGSYLIEYKNKKILFACDTGTGDVYKDIGNKFGPIDLLFINIGAYDFRPMFDKSIYHTTPEEALDVGRMVKARKVVGMHWGTFVLSLEDPFEPPVRFKQSAKKFGYNEEDAVLFKIGELKKLQQIIK